MANANVDLVIIGAGAAGIGAATAARERGLTFVLVEAMDRIGGRMHTDTSVFGVPWDLGAHWMHSASLNLLREAADRRGIPYIDQNYDWRLVEGGPGIDLAAAPPAKGSRWETEAWGRVIVAGLRGDDLPLTDVVDPTHPEFWRFRTATAAEWGYEPDRVSTIDIARYRDTHENYAVPAGYGALLATLAAGIPVDLSTPVREVRRDRAGVAVVTDRGTIGAKRAIVTVSTSVLAAGSIRFTPALPDWKLEAAVATPLGRDNKVVFQFIGPVAGVDRPVNVVTSLPGGMGMSFQLLAHGTDLAIGFLGGQPCRDAEEHGTTIEAGLAGLRAIFGNGIERQVRRSWATAWGREPTILGAYAAAEPGKAHLRRLLATPVDDRIFFAGEATSPEFFSTAHGAWGSGVEAVRAALHSIAGAS